MLADLPVMQEFIEKQAVIKGLYHHNGGGKRLNFELS